MVQPISDYQFRLILLGDSAVGKTALLKYFTNGTFEKTSNTIGLSFVTKTVKTEDGTRIKLQLFDTAGQEMFRCVPTSYYRNSVGALLVYDICDQASFKHTEYWLSELGSHMALNKPVIALVGSKLDLIDSDGHRKVTSEEAKTFAKQRGLLHIETSAKNGMNVEEAFRLVTQEVYNRYQRKEYKLEHQWDGIKELPKFNFVEPDPAKSWCC